MGSLRIYTLNDASGGMKDFMALDRNGNVGIGTITPFAKLTAKGTAGDTTFATINSSNDTTMTVLDNGNVGIGQCH